MDKKFYKDPVLLDAAYRENQVTKEQYKRRKGAIENQSGYTLAPEERHAIEGNAAEDRPDYTLEPEHASDIFDPAQEEAKRDTHTVSPKPTPGRAGREKIQEKEALEEKARGLVKKIENDIQKDPIKEARDIGNKLVDGMNPAGDTVFTTLATKLGEAKGEVIGGKVSSTLSDDIAYGKDNVNPATLAVQQQVGKNKESTYQQDIDADAAYNREKAASDAQKAVEDSANREKGRQKSGEDNAEDAIVTAPTPLSTVPKS